jgi:hypothetical protein
LLEAQLQRWIRPAAFVAGLLVVAVMVGRLGVSSTGRTLGGELRVALSPSGETEVSRLDPFLVATNMRPGGSAAHGTVSVRNIGGKTLSFRVRARPARPDLDKLVRVELSAGGSALHRGTLGTLRSWSRRAFELESGRWKQIALRVWLPASVTGGYGGRIEDVGLELKAEVPRP